MAYGPVQISNPGHSLLHAWQQLRGTVGTRSKEWLQLAGPVAVGTLSQAVHLLR